MLTMPLPGETFHESAAILGQTNPPQAHEKDGKVVALKGRLLVGGLHP